MTGKKRPEGRGSGRPSRPDGARLNGSGARSPEERIESLRLRVVDALEQQIPVRRDAQHAVLIDFGETPGSVQVFELAPGVDVYSLTQVVAWDLPLGDELRADVRTTAEHIQFGSLRLIERDVSADLVLHYSFPAGTLDGEPLREFILVVLAQGLDARTRLVG
ncbi:hypothetical protein [Tsukamurella soli]|uniref:Sensory transduction regulator n=1 Tax=Tsukamurella soli TaxID=644556 RepID=A0ABP8JD83_9ACTN